MKRVIGRRGFLKESIGLAADGLKNPLFPTVRQDLVGAGSSRWPPPPLRPSSRCRDAEVLKAAAEPGGGERGCFFTSQGRTALVNADGSGLRYFDFKVPDQVTWQPGPFLSDGRRVIFLSMETRRDGPGRPFDEYFHKTPTHLWLYDLERDTLTEIATRDRLAVFYTPAFLVSDERLLVQVVRDQGGQIFSMNLDGSDAREFTRLGEGLPYGLSLSPDGRRVAYHLASPQGYQIWTSNTEGAERVLVAAHPDHLYFGPSWSPDGQWLLFQDCHFKTDPGHDWCDLVVARPDGSENQRADRRTSHVVRGDVRKPREPGQGFESSALDARRTDSLSTAVAWLESRVGVSAPAAGR